MDLKGKLEYAFHIEGMVDRDELEVLNKYAAKVSDKGIIVDIGTADGKSAFSLALVSKPTVSVYTIDITAFESYYKHLANLELEDKLFHIEAKSQDIYDEWIKPIDMIFIDGDHEYEGIKEDIVGWVPYVRPNGIVAFHDYGNPNFEVTEAIDEFEGKLFKKIEQHKLVYIAKKI